MPNQLSLNPGAPLMRDSKGLRLPGFLEITLEGRAVHVVHHIWTGQSWDQEPLYGATDFFDAGSSA